MDDPCSVQKNIQIALNTLLFTYNMYQDGAAPCRLSFIDVLRQDYRCVDGVLHYCRQLGYPDVLCSKLTSSVSQNKFTYQEHK